MTQAVPWRIRPNRRPNRIQKNLEALIKIMCEVELKRPPRHEYPYHDQKRLDAVIKSMCEVELERSPRHEYGQ